VSYRAAISFELRGLLTEPQINSLFKWCASFAKWRWQTLYRCTSCLINLQWLRTFWVRIRAVLFATASDHHNLDDISCSIASAQFWRRLRVIHRITTWNERSRTWGSGCACHEAELLEKKKVECSQKGRRLREAPAYLERTVEANRQKVRQFDLGRDFEEDQELLLQSTHACNYHSAMTLEKFRWLWRIPWLFARCCEPHITQECLRQYDELSEDKHHPVSNEFCRPHPSSYRAWMQDVIATSRVHPRLQLEADGIAHARLSEDLLEGTHRTVSRERERATPATVPWISSSANLPQNLTLYHDIVCKAQNGEDMFTAEWWRYKSILQKPGRTATQPVRMKDKAFYTKLHRLMIHSAEDWEPCQIEILKCCIVWSCYCIVFFC